MFCMLRPAARGHGQLSAFRWGRYPIDSEAAGEQACPMTNREQTEPGGRATVHAMLDEIGEASFPASDPPQSWTWEIETVPEPPPDGREAVPAARPA